MILCTTKNLVCSFYLMNYKFRVYQPSIQSCTIHQNICVIGVKEIYSSLTIEASTRFLYKYASYMEERYDNMGTAIAL